MKGWRLRSSPRLGLAESTIHAHERHPALHRSCWPTPRGGDALQDRSWYANQIVLLGLRDHPAEQVLRDPLHPRVGSVRPHPMRPRQHMSGRMREPLRPPNGRGVEHEILARSRVNRRRPMRRLTSAAQGDSLRDNLEPGNLRRIAMKDGNAASSWQEWRTGAPLKLRIIGGPRERRLLIWRLCVCERADDAEKEQQ